MCTRSFASALGTRLPREREVDLMAGAVVSVSRVAAALRELVSRYEDMVVKDPALTSRIESALRLASYILPGRIGGSWELSELAYCLANLYALLNDYIITKKCPAANPISKCSSLQQSLLWSLSVLDCMEVGVEVSCEMVFSEAGKWGVVILMQVARAILRSVLVFCTRANLLTSPPVPIPDRKRAQALHLRSEVEEDQPLAWKAPRTGKVIRSIHSDSSVPYSELHHHISPPSPPTVPSSAPHTPSLHWQQLLAEALYIARPLVHISSMFTFKQKSWKPWLLSLAMDLVSLQLHGGLLGFKSAEKSEFLRRRVLLLLYLLRSPFYDSYTKGILTQLLQALSSTIPLAHLVVEPVLNYLPVWQGIYSYNWMT